MTDTPTDDDVTAAFDVIRRRVLAGLLATTIVSPAPAIAAPSFDPAFYLATYADIAAVVAANPAFDPAAHYQTYGRWEGRLPYKGAPVWTPSGPTDWINAPGPQVVMPDVYAPAGTAQVRIRASLIRFGASDPTPCERSYSLHGNASNFGAGDPTNGFNTGTAWLAQQELLALPSTGSVVEFVLNVPAGTTGGCNFGIGWPMDRPNLPPAKCKVWIGVPAPSGYVYPDALPVRTPTPIPTLGTPDYQSDLTNDAEFSADWTQRSTHWCFARTKRINDMAGIWTDLSDGVYPVIDGVRTFAVVDRRTNPIMNGGVGYSWGMPFVQRTFGDGLDGVIQVDVDMPVVPGIDAAIWRVATAGGWPPELDDGETLAADASRRFVTFHGAGNVQQAFSPIAPQGGRHVWTMQRQAGVYRQWRDGVLIVECPDYLAGTPLDLIASLEGPGGQAAGAIDPSVDYGAARMSIHAVRYRAG